MLNALFNTLSVIYSHVYFPTYSNGLKDIGRCLGCSWSEPDASGIQSIVWRKRWEATGSDEWKQKLTTYNLEDCAALRKVTEAVYAAVDVTPSHRSGDSSDRRAVRRPCSGGGTVGKQPHLETSRFRPRGLRCHQSSEPISTINGSGCSCGAAVC